MTGTQRCVRQVVLVPGQSARVRHSTQTPRSRSQTAPRAEQVRSEVQAVPGASAAASVGATRSVAMSVDTGGPASVPVAGADEEHAASSSAAMSGLVSEPDRLDDR